MAMPIILKPAKTYASEANALAAAVKLGLPDSVRYMIVRAPAAPERFCLVFVGNEALKYGVHFIHTVVS